MEDTKPPAAMAASSASSQQRTPVVTMIAKYGKQKFELSCLPSASTSVGDLKEMLHEKTGILPKRQKLIGLKRGMDSSSSAAVDDDTMLSDLNVKGGAVTGSSTVIVHQFILMGTPEDKIFVDPSEKADLPSIIDDFDLDFNAGSDEVNSSHASLFFVDIAQPPAYYTHCQLFSMFDETVDSAQGQRRQSPEIY
jgi:ubiquitin-like domain-containing CTD phosphatase 1